MASDSAIGGLEGAARERRERLEALKNSLTGEAENERSGSCLPAPVFRSYNPSDEVLKELKKPQSIPTPVEQHFDALHTERKIESEEVDLTSLSKKPDWDLKRIIEKPLQKLERRTQRAIAELTRERIAGAIRQDNSTTLATD